MSYAPRLLSALVALDGEALVFHPGDLPYVAAPGGPVDLASRPLTRDTLEALLDELLPVESRDELTFRGSMEWRAPLTPRYPGERFTIVAAFVNEELWVEVRRQRPGPAAEPVAQPARQPHAAGARRAAGSMPDQAGTDDLHLPPADELWKGDNNF